MFYEITADLSDCSPVISVHHIQLLRVLICAYLEEVAHIYLVVLPPEFRYLISVPSLIEM